MEGKPFNFPKTVEEVFTDFNGRRIALIKALSTDMDKFYQQCDPEKENLCLYGLPDERWEVNVPVDEVPPELPEPALGINFARNGMEVKHWISLVAIHSDAWLLSVAFYFGARFGFGKTERKKLFQMINNLPTVYEVVSGAAPQVNKHSAQNKNKVTGRVTERMQPHHLDSYLKAIRNPTPQDEDEEEEEDDEQGATLCGTCGDTYTKDEFWICCDICETWYHGECVNVTPAKAENIKHYKCPNCSGKRARRR